MPRPALRDQCLTRYVLENLSRRQPKWDRLHALIELGRRLPEEARPGLEALRRQKPLAPWKDRRALARFRRRYRKAYRREAERLFRRWRPEYQRVYGAAKKYHRMRKALYKEETRALLRARRTLRQIGSILGRLRRRTSKERYG